MNQTELAAKELVDALTKFVTGMSREKADAFATALASEHPTLLGQIAKAVGVGVMRRTFRDPDWKPYTFAEARPCERVNLRIQTNEAMLDVPVHPEHDGRLDCTTVIGAELMSRQSFI